MAEAPKSNVLIARDRTTVVIKPLVPCTAALCASMRPFVQSLEKPDITEIAFDLSAVDHMDSTFVGFLAALSTAKEGCAPGCYLAAPSDGALSVLDKMHVRPLMRIRAAAPAEPLDWIALDTVSVDPAAMADLVVDAHKRLIDADERNAQTFQPVVDSFRAARDASNPNK